MVNESGQAHTKDHIRRTMRSPGSRTPAVTRHFCRGCGLALPQNSAALFHSACLRADKRRRVRERRRQERVALASELEKMACPNCGVRLGQLAELLCEPSQRPRSDQKRRSKAEDPRRKGVATIRSILPPCESERMAQLKRERQE